LLDPAFDIVFSEQQTLTIPANYSALCDLFESIENGSARRLEAFMKEAGYKYETGMRKLAYKPGLSPLEFADLQLMKGAMRLQLFSSFSKHVRKYFSNP